MKIIVVSHGDFAKGLINSAQMLVGEQEELRAYGIYPTEDRSILSDKIEKILSNKKDGEEILILSDIFHGTPFNVCVEMMENYEFYHLTGINLPLMVEILLQRSAGSNVFQISKKVMQEASNTIKDVTQLIKGAD